MSDDGIKREGGGGELGSFLLFRPPIRARLNLLVRSLPPAPFSPISPSLQSLKRHRKDQRW